MLIRHTVNDIVITLYGTDGCCHGDHFITYANVKSQYSAPKTNIMLYVCAY